MPAVYIIFTLLNAFRRGIPRQHIWREFRRQKIALRPRLSFWLALCRQAKLLSEHPQPRVTRYLKRWLALEPDAQAFHMLEAWQNTPKNYAERRFRRKLTWKLKWDKPLTQKDLRSINGLQALGLWDGAKLTAWGKLLIKGEGSFPTPPPEGAWQIEGKHLIAPIPNQTTLLWDLEVYLRPAAPFDVYLIVIPGKELDTISVADELYEKLQNEGLSVLYDDHDARVAAEKELVGLDEVVNYMREKLRDKQ